MSRMKTLSMKRLRLSRNHLMVSTSFSASLVSLSRNSPLNITSIHGGVFSTLMSTARSWLLEPSLGSFPFSSSFQFTHRPVVQLTLSATETSSPAPTSPPPPSSSPPQCPATSSTNPNPTPPMPSPKPASTTWRVRWRASGSGMVSGSIVSVPAS